MTNSDKKSVLTCKVEHHKNKREAHQMELNIKRSEYSGTISIGNLDIEDLETIQAAIKEFLDDKDAIV